MKDNLLNVLIYLFDNFLKNTDHERRYEISTDDLHQAGFQSDEIFKAIRWLDQLSKLSFIENESACNLSGGLRVFDKSELTALSAECRGFLLQMEQQDVLSTRLRELIITCVLMLDVENIEFAQFKRIVSFVLFYQPENDAISAWLEGFFEKEHEVLEECTH